MRFCQRKVRKAKIFSNIIGVEESSVSYVTIKTYKKISIVCFFCFVFFFCTGSCLHVTPACMRYERRKSDISLGLIVMFSYIHIECFHSRGQHICKFIGTKESVCIRKEFNSQGTGLGHQHGRRFIVLGHQYGRRDVM